MPCFQNTYSNEEQWKKINSYGSQQYSKEQVLKNLQYMQVQKLAPSLNPSNWVLVQLRGMRMRLMNGLMSCHE